MEIHQLKANIKVSVGIRSPVVSCRGFSSPKGLIQIESVPMLLILIIVNSKA